MILNDEQINRYKKDGALVIRDAFKPWINILKEGFEEVLKNPHPALVGFGLAGDELHFPPHLFSKTFDMLKEENFPITVHAGEWDGPENIRKAINLLHPTRLGHGVRSIEDLELVKEIIEKDIVLETCPTSNIATKIYENYENHPVKKLFDQGVKITVNSDDPPFFLSLIHI